MRARSLLFASLSLSLLAAGCDDTRVATDGGVLPGTDGAMPGTDGAMPGTDGGTTTPTSPLVDPDCIDGMYTEALPDPSADITDLVAAYDPSNASAFIDGVLARRYSTGAELVVMGRAMRDCVATFLGDTSSADAVIRQLATIVHECGHFYDNSLSSFSSNTYALTDRPLRLTASGGDSTDRGGQTFARSRIRDDAYSSARMPCGGTFGPDCDFYADIYLDGNPDDSTFDSGDQGFSVLFEEIVQYVNSLATALAFTNELAGRGSVSERDGILNFLWYLERYLHMARLDFPSAYAHLLTGDGGNWRTAILTVWGRAWLYLEATEGMGHLGIADVALTGLVTTPELLAEIQLLRDAAGCPAP